MTNTEWLRRRVQKNVVVTAIGDKAESLEDLRRSEWSIEFETLMRNRLLVGRYRYAKMSAPSKGAYKNVSSAITRLRRYQDTGNLEYLVDAANLCLVEFVAGRHPNRHFDASDDGEHVEHIDSNRAG